MTLSVEGMMANKILRWLPVTVILMFCGLAHYVEAGVQWDLTILHTGSINGALDNCG